MLKKPSTILELSFPCLSLSNLHVFEVVLALYFAVIEKPFSLSYVPRIPIFLLRAREQVTSKQVDLAISNCWFMVTWTWKERFRNWSGRLNQCILLSVFGE